MELWQPKKDIGYQYLDDTDPKAPERENCATKFATIEKDFKVVNTMDFQVLDDLGISLKVHSKEPLAGRTLNHAKKVIEETLELFKERFLSEETAQGHYPKELNIYVFDHRVNFGEALSGIGHGPNVGGITWPSLGKIYVYKEGQNHVRNLSHELSHFLFHCATSGNYAQGPGEALLDEGLGEYVQQMVESGGMDFMFMRRADNVLDMLRNDPEIRGAETIDDIARVINSHSDDEKYISLKYSLGMMLVSYNQEHDSNILRDDFVRTSSGPYSVRHNPLNDIPEDFETWLEGYSVKNFAIEHGLLSTAPGSDIGFREDIVGGKVSRVNVHMADLVTARGEVVGTLSPVAHIAAPYSSIVRSINPYTTDFFDIPKEYHHLKLMSIPGTLSYGSDQQYVYCNENGDPFFLSQDPRNVSLLGRLMSKYDEECSQLAQMRSDLADKYSKYIRSGSQEDLDAYNGVANTMYSALESAMNKLVVDHKSISDVAKDIAEDTLMYWAGKEYATLSVLSDAYDEYIVSRVNNLLRSFDSAPDAPKIATILSTLISIDPMSIKATSGINVETLPNNTILTLDATGTGNYSGVSIYLPEGKKIGELPSLAQAMQGLEGETKSDSDFVIYDTLKTIFSAYPEAPMMVLSTNEAGNKVINLVSDARKPHDSNEFLISTNEFFDAYELGSIKEDVPVSKGVQVVARESYTDYLASTSDEDTKTVIRKGELVDDRGTESTSDDVYDATLYQGNKVVAEKLSSMQFYMSERVEYGDGNVLESAFFIRDKAADKVFQFPSSITHLKLMKTSNGDARLVPCTKDGDTHPTGMPEGLGKYAYIDTIFVYDRLEVDWIAQHSKLNLVDFRRYDDGAMFKLQYNQNDPAIPKDENGNVVRIGNNPHFARVEIISESSGEKIGELSSAPTFAQGDIVISFDTTYSHSDFASSLHEQVAEVQDVQGDMVRVSLTGEGDLGTDKGYSDYYSFVHRSTKDNEDVIRELDARISAEKQFSSNAAQVNASDEELSVLKNTVVCSRKDASGRDILFIYNSHERECFQFPDKVTHLKVVSKDGQKYLAPSTADGVEHAENGSQDTGYYINPILVHTDVRIFTDSVSEKVLVSLANLDSYEEGTLLSMQVTDSKPYKSLDVRDDEYLKTIHLFDGEGREVGVLSRHFDRIRGDISIFREEPDQAHNQEDEYLVHHEAIAVISATHDATHGAAQEASFDYMGHDGAAVSAPQTAASLIPQVGDLNPDIGYQDYAAQLAHQDQPTSSQVYGQEQLIM